MTNRRTFLQVAAGGLLLSSCAAMAQMEKVWRIGFFGTGPRPPDGAPPEAFRAAMHELGYVDGKNVAYVGRWAETKRSRLPGLAAELVGMKLDVIVTLGDATSEALKQAT